MSNFKEIFAASENHPNTTYHPTSYGDWNATIFPTAHPLDNDPLSYIIENPSTTYNGSSHHNEIEYFSKSPEVNRRCAEE
jgi:hypothetical protein